VLIGFVGTAYITLGVLILRYLIGLPQETILDVDFPNPVDAGFLGFFWRRIGRPPERWAEAFRTVSFHRMAF
jgi:hypothetical protein